MPDIEVTDAMVAAYGNAWALRNHEVGAGVAEPFCRAGLKAALALIEPAPGIVEVSAELWKSMQADVLRLRALEAAGVDNWEGYGLAILGLYGDEDVE